MRVTFWGVRGSYPVPGTSTLRYGGNTSCVSIEPPGGPLLILDAGTGIRELGKELMTGAFGQGSGVAHLLISHTHWDHVQGFPFFQPIYRDGNEIHIYGMEREDAHLLGMFRDTLHEERYFPVPLNALRAKVEFHEVPQGDSFDIAGMKATTVLLNHPWAACGYRLDTPDGSVAYLSDTAPFKEFLLGREYMRFRPQRGADDMETAQELWAARHSVLEAVQGVDLLIHDAQFTPDEFEAHPHWGHATPQDAIDLGKEVGAGRVVLFHHSPERADDAMDALLEQARSYAGADGPEVIAAAEGMVLEVGSESSDDAIAAAEGQVP